LPHDSLPTSVSFSADGKVLAVGLQDGSVRLWDPAAGRALGTLVLPDGSGEVSDLALAPDGNALALVRGGQVWRADLTRTKLAAPRD
jgi:WD40 repeat protein